VEKIMVAVDLQNSQNQSFLKPVCTDKSALQHGIKETETHS